MSSLLILILIVAFFAWYLSYSATRLDRLHHRVETSWANLDSLLQRLRRLLRGQVLNVHGLEGILPQG